MFLDVLLAIVAICFGYLLGVRFPPTPSKKSKIGSAPYGKHR